MMPRSLLALELVALLATPVLCQTPDDLDALAYKLDQLAEEMQLIEELNTLQLTAVQLQTLQGEVAEIRGAIAPIIAARVGVLQQLEPLLKQKRASLIVDQQPPDELLNDIAAREDQLADLDARMDETITAFAPRLRQILSEPQIALVSGEEDARRQVVMLLEVIRDMDADRFNREAPGYAAELERPEEALSAQHIVNIFTTARNLAPEDYQQQQGELVEGLMPIYAPSEEVADAMLAHFFAQPQMPRLLEDKLQAMGNNG